MKPVSKKQLPKTKYDNTYDKYDKRSKCDTVIILRTSNLIY